MKKSAKSSSYFEINPSIIRFQHSKIKPVFSDGKSIESSYNEVKSNIEVLENIPKILVKYDNEGNYYSFNNRRLFLYKRLYDDGLIKCIQVRLEKLKDNETNRYTKENCSLNAKYMYCSKEKNEEKEEKEIKPKENQNKIAN